MKVGKKNNDTGLNDIRPKPGLSWANWDVHVPRYKVKVKVTQSCPTLCDPMDYTIYGILQARILGVGSLSLLQGILPTQGSNPGLLHCSQTLYQLSHKESLAESEEELKSLLMRVKEESEKLP